MNSHGADIFPSLHSNSLFYTATYAVSANLLSKILHISNETLYSNPTQIPGGIIWSLAFEPLPTQLTKLSQSKGGNSLGTTPADGNGVSEYPHPLPQQPSIPYIPNVRTNLDADTIKPVVRCSSPPPQRLLDPLPIRRRLRTADGANHHAASQRSGAGHGTAA